MQRIVVAYDGSEAARRALERAADLASTGASVTVVSAVSAHHPAAGRSSGAVDPEEIAERSRELREAVELLAERGITAETVEAVGDPPDAIVEAAEKVGANLIVVGTRGRSLSKRVLLGSVSTGIVHHAPCDVLVVR